MSPANYYRENRVYLFDPQGNPLLLLHPFYIVYQRELYSFGSQNRDEKPRFRCCRDEGIYQPQEVDSYILPAIASGDTDALQTVEISVPEEAQTATTRERGLIENLSEEARAILEIAAGEALRMKDNSVNEAHLFMAMTRCEETTVAPLLRELKLSPPQMRAALREMVGFHSQVPRWSMELLQNAGTTALHKGDVRLSSRLEEVLEKAHALAQAEGTGTVKPLHLLKAMLQLSQGLVAHFFKVRGYEPDELFSILLAEEPTRIIPLEEPTQFIEQAPEGRLIEPDKLEMAHLQEVCTLTSEDINCGVMRLMLRRNSAIAT